MNRYPQDFCRFFSTWFEEDGHEAPAQTIIETQFEDRYADYIQRMTDGDDSKELTRSLHELALAKTNIAMQAQIIGYLQTSIQELTKAVKELKQDV